MPIPMRSLLGVAFLASGVAGCGKPPLSPTDPTPGAPHFTVMSYNVLAADPSTLDTIEEGNADIVALQEVFPRAEGLLRERFSGIYPYMLFHPAGGAAGLGAFSRYPLTDKGVRPGPGGWHPAWHFEVDVPGVPLQVLNVHLRSLFGHDTGPLASYLSSDRDHVREIQDFSEQCDSTRSNLVLGDFNEGPSGDAINYLEDLGFQNALPAFHPGQPTWRFRSVGDQLETTLDHILYDETLKALNAWVEVGGSSDHLPVLAHFEPHEWPE